MSWPEIRINLAFLLRGWGILMAWSIAACTSGEPAASREPETDYHIETAPQSPLRAAPRPACHFDSLNFRKRMGYGLVRVTPRMHPFPLFNSPGDEEASRTVAVFSVAQGDSVVTEGKTPRYIQWYRNPDEYEKGGLLWKSGSRESRALLVSIQPNGWDYWVRLDSLENPNGLAPQTWDAYLKGQTILIPEEHAQDNPLRTLPTDTASIVPFPDKYRLYTIQRVSMPWVQVNHLIEKHGPYGSDTWSQPLGWLRWYCDGKERIRILDFYELERFYLAE